MMFFGTEMILKFISLSLMLQACSATAYDPEASITGLYTGPYFDPLAPRNLTAHLGDEATLPCTVRQLGDKSVSWVRVRDADILTVDRYTFVGDERFESHYNAELETWNLVIKYVQERDAGLYECQVSTEPKMSQVFSLRVVIPKVTIVPPGDRYVKAGSTVRVDCQITDVVQLPDYIFWYHEDRRVMDRRDPNLQVQVKRTGAESITSTLTIHRVRREESGNYTCMPSNLHAASVTLHVLNEKHPAAMQAETSGAGAVQAGKTQLLLPFFLLLLLLVLGSSSSSSSSFSSSLGPNEEDNKTDTKPRQKLDQGPSPGGHVPCSSSPLSSSSSSAIRFALPASSLAPLVPVPPSADAFRGSEQERMLEILGDVMQVLTKNVAVVDLQAERGDLKSVLEEEEGQVALGRSWMAGGAGGLPSSSPGLSSDAGVPLLLKGDPLASFLESLDCPRMSVIDNPAHCQDLLLPSATAAVDRRHTTTARALHHSEGDLMTRVTAVPSWEVCPGQAYKTCPGRQSARVQETR